MQLDRIEVATSAALAFAFAEHRVRTVFTLLGDGNMHFCVALAEQHGARLVHVRHEHNAVTAAMGYASATGEVGVASVTCGPGLAQLGTALVSAARNRVPLVVFAGETPLGALWHNQTFAPEPFAAACETHIISIRDQKHALSRVRDAFHIARRDRAPVILSVPIDVQAQAFSDELRVDPAPDLSSRSGSRLDSAAARTIAEQLLAARNPVLLAGKGAVSSGADVGIAALANRVGALLATTLKAKGMFDDHPYSLGVCGGFASDTAREALAQCDLLLAFGASLNNYTLGGGDLMPKARIVQIDTAPDSVVAGRIVADESHASDAEKAVEAIMEALGNGHSEAVARTPELASDLRNRPADATDFDIEPGRADPRAVFSELETVLPAGVDIVSGAGHDAVYVAKIAPAGMIFVPSIGGISHAPEEDTAWPDIEAGTNLLLHTLLDVAAAKP